MKMEGGDVVARALDAAALAGADGAKQGLELAAQHMLAKSNAQAPHEEGDMIRTGAVSSDGSGRVVIFYDTEYAVKQHEDMSLRHDAGRNAKFLENSMNSEREIGLQLVAAAVRRAMGL